MDTKHVAENYLAQAVMHADNNEAEPATACALCSIAASLGKLAERREPCFVLIGTTAYNLGHADAVLFQSEVKFGDGNSAADSVPVAQVFMASGERFTVTGRDEVERLREAIGVGRR